MAASNKFDVCGHLNKIKYSCIAKTFYARLLPRGFTNLSSPKGEGLQASRKVTLIFHKKQCHFRNKKFKEP